MCCEEASENADSGFKNRNIYVQIKPFMAVMIAYNADCSPEFRVVAHDDQRIKGVDKSHKRNLDEIE